MRMMRVPAQLILPAVLLLISFVTPTSVFGNGISKDHILVRFKPESESKSLEILKQHGLSQQGELKQIGVKIVLIPEDKLPEQAAAVLSQNPEVEFAETDSILEPDFLPSDGYFGSEWHLEKIQAPLAWDTASGTGVTIAILDSGVDCTHPDLLCVPGWNFYSNNSDASDVNGHGTAVAGTAAAVLDNGVGVSGVSGRSLIMPLRVSDGTGYALSSTIASALTWAADHGVKVANASYNVASSQTVASAAKYFVSKGGLFTVSAGNDSAALSYPDNPDILTVAATDKNDAHASWSNSGPHVDLSAPGDGILTTCRNGGYCSGSGTSFSAPIAAGIGALILSANPALNGAQAYSILKNTADDLGALGPDPVFGAGRVNAYKAVLAAKNLANPTPPPAPPTPVADTLSPSVPQNLIASYSASAGSVALVWQASTDDTGVASYEIFRNGGLYATVYSPAISFTDSSILAGTNYSYAVRSVDPAGNRSALSNSYALSIPVSVSPSQPPQVEPLSITNHSIAVSGSNVIVSWTTNEPSTGYAVLSKNGGQAVTVSDSILGTEHTVEFTSLRKGTYKVAVTANTASESITSQTYVFKINR